MHCEELDNVINAEPSANLKKIKLNHSEQPKQSVAIVIPIMAKRIQDNIHTYISWMKNGFDLKFAVSDYKDEDNEVMKLLQEYNLHTKISELLKSYSTMSSEGPNAGIAKSAAHQIIQEYLDQPDFMYAILLDDTVDDIKDTKSRASIMTSPSEFCRVVKPLAEQFPIFGGTVAAGRHRKRCRRGGIVQGGFLQQAIIFSCRGAPSLHKHFKDAKEYLIKMRELTYRKVPFGEDVSFQIALYEKEVLPSGKSAQFWNIGIHRIPHDSATKGSFANMPQVTKEALKEMIVYLNDQGALKIDPDTNKLIGIRVIPGENVRIGSEGERPWREAYNYTFPNPQ